MLEQIVGTWGVSLLHVFKEPDDPFAVHEVHVLCPGLGRFLISS